MISIVISEKGGAERRERYDQNEVTIGRVKGNDVLLPKGNVSKRHARLIVRDGRYIVTDLKSTNGTYVNHRRITHATLVREGDRIYVGDFVLRIEGDKASTATSEQQLHGSHDSSTSSPSGEFRASTGGRPAVKSSPPAATSGGQNDVVSHFPIEHDPDESSPSVDVPGPPRVPSGFKSSGTGSTPVTSSVDGPLTSDSLGTTSGSMGVPAVSSEPRVRSSRPVVDHQREQKQATLSELVTAVEKKLGVEALDAVKPAAAFVKKVEEALDSQLATMLESGPLPGNLERTAWREAALAELVELGPLGPLLEDDNITKIHVLLRELVVHRRGKRVMNPGLGYGSEAGIARTISRLCAGADVEMSDKEPYIEARLDGGRELFAVRPSASPEGHLLVVTRMARPRSSLDVLVRHGAISRGIATLLTHCMAARANILVTGSSDSGVSELVDALALAAPHHARGVWLCEHDDDCSWVPPGAARICLKGAPEERERAIGAATRLATDHLLVPPLSGSDLATLLDAITRGREGVVMCTRSGTLRQAFGRLSTDLASARSSISPPVAHEWVGSSFDIAIEVARLRDGRPRVARLSEFRSSSAGHHSLRDIFTFAYHRTAAGGSVEGSFYASGTVPRIVEELAARGMPLDTSIFRRHPSS